MKKTFSIIALLSVYILTSCSNDDSNAIVVNTKTPVVLNYEKTLQIDATSESPMTYESENRFHADVDSKGVITGGHVGETNIIISNGKKSQKIPITIEPLHDLYKTPCPGWGKSKNEIIAVYGYPDNETETVIGYTNYSNAAPLVMYLFDDNDLLMASSVIVKMGYTSSLVDFLLERYIPIAVDSKEYTAVFMNEINESKITTAIYLSVYNMSYMMVLYMDVRGVLNNTRAVDDTILNEFRGAIESFMNF